MKKRASRKEEVAQQHRDIVVLGASAGGLEAVREILAGLPAGARLSLFVVVHTSPRFPSYLAEALAGASKLPVAYALDGEPIRPARVYVAPPDNHLMIGQGRLRVVRGPRENGHRPAVDALFRTAARHLGSRVVGVVLSGALDCGSVGLRLIKAAGGIAVVQQPEDAAVPDMPRNALHSVQPDYVLPAGRIAGVLQELAARATAAAPVPSRPAASPERAAPGKNEILACPDCGGPLQEYFEAGLPRLRCKVGHVYSAESFDVEQAHSVESALWSAVRALKERAQYRERLARRTPTLAGRMRENAESLHEHARVIERMLVAGVAGPGGQAVAKPSRSRSKTSRSAASPTRKPRSNTSRSRRF